MRKHTDCAWVLLYVERWLKAPAMLEGGDLVARDRGTPQGGVISPLLANLFLHYAFDLWIGREMPGVTFERYADDIICHCRSEREARKLWRAVDERFAACGLVLHPRKTKLVYCKDTNRTGEHDCVGFDFLGYTFRPRLAKWRGGLYGVSFLPAASPKALKAIRHAVRGWGLQRRSDKGLFDIARMFNQYIRGWVDYFSHFYKSALYPTLRRIDAHLASSEPNGSGRPRGRPFVVRRRYRPTIWAGARVRLLEHGHVAPHRVSKQPRRVSGREHERHALGRAMRAEVAAVAPGTPYISAGEGRENQGPL